MEMDAPCSLQEFNMTTSKWIQTPDRKMLTFDKEQKKCVPENVSACNTHTGNIFETDEEYTK